MARWNLKKMANASNISLQEFIEFETQLTVFIDGRNLQMQYEVISVFESHCVLFLMIAMHWRVVVGLKSCRYTLTRVPAVVWEGRRERVSCRSTPAVTAVRGRFVEIWRHKIVPN